MKVFILCRTLALICWGGLFNITTLRAEGIGYSPASTPFPAVVAGISVGTVGAAGTPYAGFTFSGGDDFSSANISVVCPNNPNGRYFTSRPYQITASALNGARGAYQGTTYTGLQGYDIDTCHTGFGDTGRGAPLSTYNDIVVQSGGALSLKARVASAAELQYPNAADPILSSMISTPGFFVGIPPFVVEARVRYNPSQVSGFHPSFWALQSGGYNSIAGSVQNGVESNNNFEVDFEGASSAQNVSPNRYAWAAGTPTNFTATGANGSLPWDGNYHLETYVFTATGVTWYVDGNPIRSDTISTSPYGVKPFYSLLSNHVTNQAGDSYSTGAWTTIGAVGAVSQYNYLGWWHSSSSVHRTPAPQADINIPWSASWPQTVTLPSSLAVWGQAVTSDWIEAIPNEADDPWVSYANGASWTGLPSQITPTTNGNNGTVSLSIAQPNRAGRLTFTRTGGNAGDTVTPQRFTIHIGPNYRLPASLGGISGSAFRYNLATDCDTGAEQKSITITDMPTSGWTFGSTPGPTYGLLQSASLSATPVTMHVVCADAVTGQSVTTAVTIGPLTAGTGAALPTFTEGAPILSIDYDLLSSLTLSTTSITAAAGADGTSAALTQGTTALAPTSSLVGVRNGATFNGTTQFMDGAAMITANAAAFEGPHTMIVVATPTSTVGAPSIWVDVGLGTASTTVNRSDLGTTSANLLFRSGAATADATQVGVTTSGIHLFTGRRLMGSPQDLQTTLDLGGDLPGYGSPVTSSALSSLPTVATIGARFAASAYGAYAPAVIYKVVIYPWCLTPQEMGQIKNWAVNNYGA